MTVTFADAARIMGAKLRGWREGHAAGFDAGLRAAIAALYWRAGHLDAVASDLRRRCKDDRAADCERLANRALESAVILDVRR